MTYPHLATAKRLGGNLLEIWVSGRTHITSYKFLANRFSKIGVPHQVIKDDVHDGYFIPKGSIILPNVWSFTHDPALFRDPEVYNPSRFLPTDGSEPETNPMELIFGFGRR